MKQSTTLPAESFSPADASPPASSWLWPALVSLFIFGLWGLQSKVVSERVSPVMNQILTTPGVLAIAFLLRRKREQPSQSQPGQRRMAIGCAFLTGILGTMGNMTFYEALSQGGKASIVVPLTTLYPMVTLAMAASLLRETIKARQWAGIVLAIIAILILGG